MDSKIPYQLEMLEARYTTLQEKLDTITAQVVTAEKSLIVLEGKSAVVEKALGGIQSKSGWLYKIITAGFITAIIGWIVAGGLAK